jgi:hypothetical protein
VSARSGITKVILQEEEREKGRGRRRHHLLLRKQNGGASGGNWIGYPAQVIEGVQDSMNNPPSMSFAGCASLNKKSEASSISDS